MPRGALIILRLIGVATLPNADNPSRKGRVSYFDDPEKIEITSGAGYDAISSRMRSSTRPGTLGVAYIYLSLC
jgi:hypothetical protein